MPTCTDFWARCRRHAGCLLTVGLLTTRNYASAQAPAKQWDKSFGSTADDYLRTIEQTTDGGYILGSSSAAGINGDKTQSSQGALDYWVVKLDSSGNKRWDKGFGGSDDDELWALQPTSDGGYILGGYSYSGLNGDKTQANQGESDYWILKLDANGNKVWDKTLGGLLDDVLYTIQQTSDGGYILGGMSSSGIGGDKTQPSQGLFDYWVVKLDASGNKVWDKTLGGSSTEAYRTLEPTSDGGYLVGGLSASGSSGDKTQASHGGWDYWVVKLDASGTTVWDQGFGSRADDYMQVLQPTTDGGYLLGGYSNGGIDGDKTQVSQGGFDYWLIRLDANGTRLWDKAFGGSENDDLYSLQPTSDGGYLLGGISQSALGGDKTQDNQGEFDYWTIRLDANGNKQWDLTLGGDSADLLLGLQQTSDGGYVLGGYSQSGISGDKTTASLGGNDFWVVKLGPTAPNATKRSTSRQALQVYPNPASNHLTVQLPDTAPRIGLHLTLLDATGRTVYARQLPTATNMPVPMEIGLHPTGLYLLRLEGPNGYLATQRLVLE